MYRLRSLGKEAFIKRLQSNIDRGQRLFQLFKVDQRKLIRLDATKFQTDIFDCFRRRSKDSYSCFFELINLRLKILWIIICSDDYSDKFNCLSIFSNLTDHRK